MFGGFARNIKIKNKEALDAFVENPKIDLYKFLFPPNSS